MSQLTVSQFLSAFYPNESERLWLAFIEPKDIPLAEGEQRHCEKFDTSRHKITTIQFVKLKVLRMNLDHGVFFHPNAGGNCDADINRFSAVFCERDDISIPEQHRLLDQSPLETSIRVETRKSVHAYWLLKENCTESEWRQAQQQIIHNLNADKKNNNPSRLMRLPFFNHISFGNPPKRVEAVQFETDNRYSIEEILGSFPEVKIEANNSECRYLPKPGYKFFDVDPFAGRYEQFKQWVITQVETFGHGKRDKHGNYSTKCPLHNGVGCTSLYLLASGAIGCNYCGSGREFLDACMRKLNLQFKNSLTNQFYYEKKGGICVAA